LNRRAFCGAAAALASTVVAAAPSFDGTWGGAEGDLSAQVIVSGTSVIGFFWRTDYAETRDAKLSADGRSLSFDFAGGRAVLTRDAETSATLVVTEGGRVTRLKLARDP
jgi:hypothetical protein